MGFNATFQPRPPKKGRRKIPNTVIVLFRESSHNSIGEDFTKLAAESGLSSKALALQMIEFCLYGAGKTKPADGE